MMSQGQLQAVDDRLSLPMTSGAVEKRPFSEFKMHGEVEITAMLSSNAPGGRDGGHKLYDKPLSHHCLYAALYENFNLVITHILLLTRY